MAILDNLKFPIKRPILVTGSHRSGSTWVGKMLDLSNQTYYLGEIFNPKDGRLSQKLLTNWFLYIPVEEGRDHDIYKPLEQILRLNFSWPNRLGVRSFLPSRLILFRHTYKWFGFPRPIMKDPIAVLSAEWLAQVFNMDVICLIRHPAAFVYSLAKANWDFNFR